MCTFSTTKLSANAGGISLNGYEWKVISTPDNCTFLCGVYPGNGKDSIMPQLQINGPAGDYVVRLIGSNRCGNDTAQIILTAYAQPDLITGPINPGCDSLIVNFGATSVVP